MKTICLITVLLLSLLSCKKKDTLENLSLQGSWKTIENTSKKMSSVNGRLLSKYYYPENQFLVNELEIEKDRIKFKYEAESEISKVPYTIRLDSATKIAFLAVGERKIQYKVQKDKLYLVEPLAGATYNVEEPFYYLIETVLIRND